MNRQQILADLQHRRESAARDLEAAEFRVTQARNRVDELDVKIAAVVASLKRSPP